MPRPRFTGRLAATVVLVAFVAGWAAQANATAPGRNGRIVFRRYLDVGRSTGALFTVNPTGTKIARLTRPPRSVVDQEADWSPDGRNVAFQRMLPCPAAGPKNGLDNTCDLIYIVNRDGAVRSVVPCGFKADAPFPGNCVGAHQPAWSPDGTKLAFRYTLVDPAYVDSFRLSSAIWIVNADGSGLHQVTQRTPGSTWDFGPQWSPDGAKLVFYRVDLKRQADAVFTVGADGTGEFQVTPWELGAGDAPDWSPDGQWLLFRAEPKDGSSNVYKAHPDGAALTNLTRQGPRGYHYLSSSFSPDGTKITTARTPGTGPSGAADVLIMNIEGSNIRRVTKSNLWESATDWGTAPLR